MKANESIAATAEDCSKRQKTIAFLWSARSPSLRSYYGENRKSCFLTWSFAVV